MIYKEKLYEQLKNNIESDCEDFYLCEIEEKAKKYDELIDYLKEKIKLCKDAQQLSLKNKIIEQIGNFNLRIATYNEILSKIEKR